MNTKCRFILLMSIIAFTTSTYAAVSCQDLIGKFNGSMGSGTMSQVGLEVTTPYDVWVSFNDQASGLLGCPTAIISCNETSDGKVVVKLGADNLFGFKSSLSGFMPDANHLVVTSFHCEHDGAHHLIVDGQGTLSK